MKKGLVFSEAYMIPIGGLVFVPLSVLRGYNVISWVEVFMCMAIYATFFSVLIGVHTLANRIEILEKRIAELTDRKN